MEGMKQTTTATVVRTTCKMCGNVTTFGKDCEFTFDQVVNLVRVRKDCVDCDSQDTLDVTVVEE